MSAFGDLTDRLAQCRQLLHQYQDGHRDTDDEPPSTTARTRRARKEHDLINMLDESMPKDPKDNTKSGKKVADATQMTPKEKQTIHKAIDAQCEKRKKMIGNVRLQRIQQDVSLTGEWARWRVTELDGRQRTYPGLTRKLAALFFSPDIPTYDVRAAPVSDIGTITCLPNEVEYTDDAGDGSVSLRDVNANVQPEVRVVADDGVDDFLHCGPKCKRRGLEHGRLVHSELQRFIVARCKYQRYNAYFNEPDWDGSAPDPCTVQILRHVCAQKWVPIAAELCTFDSNIRVATAIDLVVLDLVHWNIGIIEIKTGYGGAPGTRSSFTGYNDCPRMRGPMSDIPDTPLQRAVLQLVCTHMMMYMGELYDYSGLDSAKMQVALPDNMYVLHVNPCTLVVTQYAMPPWVKQHARRAAIYQAFVDAVGVPTGVTAPAVLATAVVHRPKAKRDDAIGSVLRKRKRQHDILDQHARSMSSTDISNVCSSKRRTPL